ELYEFPRRESKDGVFLSMLASGAAAVAAPLANIDRNTPKEVGQPGHVPITSPAAAAPLWLPRWEARRLRPGTCLARAVGLPRWPDVPAGARHDRHAASPGWDAEDLPRAAV